MAETIVVEYIIRIIMVVLDFRLTQMNESNGRRNVWFTKKKTAGLSNIF